MELFYFTAQEELDSFIKSAADTRGAEFLQSWQWGEILKADGAEVLRVGARLEGKILAAATITKKPLLGGYVYWYAPRGPIISAGLRPEEREIAENFLITEIKKIDCRVVFLRIEPRELTGARTVEQRFKMRKSLDLQPKQTLILDLALSEEGILKGLRQKTRYNINLAAKKGLEIKEGSGADFSEFWRLLNLTGARDNFRLHGAGHYRNLLNEGRAGEISENGPRNFIKLFFVEQKGKKIAAGLFCFWGDKATYLHGASDNAFRELMAPYLLQWSVIRKAKESGYKYYDFFGIDEKNWPGVTRFKLGFGGRTENYPGTYDVVFHSVLYGFYEFTRKLKRLI